MANVNAPRIVAGVTAGYLLGRTRKLKLAFMVGSLLANRKLVSGQVDKLTDAAGVGPLGEQLVSAGRKAAIGAVSSRIDSFSDKLSERTDALNGVASDEDEEEDEDEEDDEGEEPEDEYDEEDPAEDEEEEEPEDEYEEEPADEDEPVDEDEEPVDDEDEYEEPAEDEEEPVDEEEELAEEEDEYEEPADDDEEFDEDEEATA
jgi:hypothetical protein